MTDLENIVPGGKARPIGSGRDYQPPRPYRRDAGAPGPSAPEAKTEQVRAALAAGPLTTGQIATATGLSRDDVNKALHYLRRRGLADTDILPDGSKRHWLPAAADAAPLPAATEALLAAVEAAQGAQPAGTHVFDLGTPDGAAEALLASASALAEMLKGSLGHLDELIETQQRLRQAEARAQLAEQQLAAVRAALEGAA